MTGWKMILLIVLLALHVFIAACNSSAGISNDENRDDNRSRPEQRMINNQLVDFYHYTNKNAVDAIKASGIIKMTPAGGPDAFEGAGVYGTSLPPSSGKQAIAKNNWNNGGPSKVAQGLVDWAIHVEIPSNEVKRYNPNGRQIYRYPDRSLNLTNYQWTLEKVTKP